MKTPHKHAELIKAWADGAEIEYKEGWREWKKCEGQTPVWDVYTNYRIKPEPKPDIVRYRRASLWWGHETVEDGDNLKITFDGETGDLKSAEVSA